MSERQDRITVRTPADLERKYNFGKSFSEILGLIDDNREKVESVNSELRNEITEQATSITRNTEQIVMQATQTVKKELTDSINDVGEEVSELTKQVELAMTAEEVAIAVRNEVAGGIELETGYKFDADGLSISKSGQDMKNLLDNTGMYVTRSGDEILTANKDGVNAVNLHASTYLIIGAGEGRSRIEDYGIDRTGVFWIGG